MKFVKFAVISIAIVCVVVAAFMFKAYKTVENTVAQTPVAETTSVEPAAIEPAVIEKSADPTPVDPAPAAPAVEEQATDTPVVDTPAVDTPVSEPAVIEQSADPTPVDSTPAAPVVEEQATDTPVVDTPVVEPAAVEKIVEESAFSVAAYISPFSFRGVYYLDEDNNYTDALLSTYGLGAKIKTRYNFYKNCFVALDISEQTYFEKHYGNYNDVLFCAKLGHKYYYCENAYTFAETGVGLDLASFEDECKAYLTAELEFGFGYCINDNLAAEISEEVTWNWQNDSSAFRFNTYVGLVYKF